MLLICKTTNAQTGTRIGANFPPQQSEDKTKIIFENLTIRFKPSRELDGIRSLRLEFSNSAPSDEKQSVWQTLVLAYSLTLQSYVTLHIGGGSCQDL